MKRVRAGVVGLTLALAGAEAAGQGDPGWIRLEREELGVVYGLRKIVKIAGQPPLLGRAEEWVPPMLSTDGALTYVAPEAGGLFALWTGSGQTLWKLPELGRVGLGMTQIDDVLVAGVDGALVGLEGYSGKELWRTDIGGVVGGPMTLSSSVAIVPVRPNGYVAVYAHTGRIKWRQKRAKTDAITQRGQAQATVDAARGLVYVGTSAGEALALKLETGEVAWTVKLASPKHDVPFPDVDARPLLVDHGRSLLVASYNGGLASLDPQTGAERWRRAELENVTGLTEVEGSARVVASIGDGVVAGIDPIDGGVRWRYRLRGSVPTTPTALEHGLVAVGSSNGPIAILDAATGRPRQLLTPGSGISAPLDRRGKELVGWTNKGHVLLLRLGQGTAVTAL